MYPGTFIPKHYQDELCLSKRENPSWEDIAFHQSDTSSVTSQSLGSLEVSHVEEGKVLSYNQITNMIQNEQDKLHPRMQPVCSGQLFATIILAVVWAEAFCMKKMITPVGCCICLLAEESNNEYSCRKSIQFTFPFRGFFVTFALRKDKGLRRL